MVGRRYGVLREKTTQADTPSLRSFSLRGRRHWRLPLNPATWGHTSTLHVYPQFTGGLDMIMQSQAYEALGPWTRTNEKQTHRVAVGEA